MTQTEIDDILTGLEETKELNPRLFDHVIQTAEVLAETIVKMGAVVLHGGKFKVLKWYSIGTWISLGKIAYEMYIKLTQIYKK